MAFRTLDHRHADRPPKHPFTNITEPRKRPPTYTSGMYAGASRYHSPNSRRNPRNWSKRSWIILGIIVTILLIIVIAIAVTVIRANRYPTYSKLNYRLAETYAGESFFDSWDYFTGYDPAGGFVHYVDGPGSVALNLTYATATTAILRVDTSTTNTTTGRKSVRIESKSTYNTGLFIFDVLHSPYGCSTWPALWLADPSNWPMNGEIDIMEATNAALVGNQMTLHTARGCSMSVKRKESGKSLASNCYNGTNGNAGCGVRGAPATFGRAFNDAGGGVYATELREAGIRTWFFPRASIPADIDLSASSTSATPDPSTWGEALADFPSTECDVGAHFRNQSIIANIDLCGQWAGLTKYYSAQSGCPGTCVDYVSTQPGSSYDEAYWEFGSMKVWTAS